MQKSSQASPTSIAAAQQTSRRGLLLAPVVIFVGLVSMFAFALHKGDPSKLPSALVGRAAPPLALAPLEGLVGDGGQPVPGIEANAFKTGGVSVVNFWASWCVPCVQEHPLLVRLAERADVTLYGVNHKDQAVNARRFLGRYGNPFKAVGVDANGRAAVDWGVYGMPETFIVDGRGIIVYKHVGQLTPAALEGNIIPAIRAAAKGQ
ncbi:MAG: DsbE family thiol:disulfide interchange protein [Hyphomicrobiaceae bacterium]|jgi:cytochrome c biogenesis protein CcmG, thiol:disulfide interchange protein DsbE